MTASQTKGMGDWLLELDDADWLAGSVIDSRGSWRKGSGNTSKDDKVRLLSASTRTGSEKVAVELC